jgi:hypothetical protein
LLGTVKAMQEIVAIVVAMTIKDLIIKRIKQWPLSLSMLKMI